MTYFFILYLLCILLMLESTYLKLKNSFKINYVFIQTKEELYLMILQHLVAGIFLIIISPLLYLIEIVRLILISRKKP